MKKQALKKRARKMELLEDSMLCRYLPAYYQQAKIFAYMLSELPGGLKVLDLACGGGSLSYLVMQLHKHSRVVGFDQTPEALEAYNRNLSAFSGRVETIMGTPGDDVLGHGYDLVISSMALGNIEDEIKPVLCSQIFHCLNPGGLFVTRDFILGVSPGLNQQYLQSWRKEMASSEMEHGLFDGDARLCDHPAPLDYYLSGLKSTGFADVDCHWRYLNFAIFGGRKPEVVDPNVDDNDGKGAQPL